MHEGQVVNQGELIVDGPEDPHDILRLLGIEALARYIVDEVQDVYRLQGGENKMISTSEVNCEANVSLAEFKSGIPAILNSFQGSKQKDLMFMPRTKSLLNDGKDWCDLR